MEAWRAVLGAHASLTGSLEEALRDADLPPLSWLNLLWALDQAPDKRLRMNELAAHLNVSRGGLTKLVDRLEGAGLIGRARPAPADRRGYHAALLPTGADMLGKMWPVYEAELERHLSASDQRRRGGDHPGRPRPRRSERLHARQKSRTARAGEEPVGSSARG